MQLRQRRIKNYNSINSCSFTRIISLLNLHLLKGDISFFASFLQLLNFFPFLGADCVFSYFVTLHERFIYLEIKLLPKRK